MPRFTGQNSTTTSYTVRAQSPGDAPSHGLAPNAAFDFFVDDEQAAEIRTQLGTLTGVAFTEADALAQPNLTDLGTPAAAGSTDVHAAFAGNDASNDFPGAFTNPDVPRAIRCVFAASYDGGDITVVGTGLNDEPVTEVITAVAASTVEGTKTFKTVTAAQKAAVGANAATVSIGHGLALSTLSDMSDAIGLLFSDGTAEAGTFDPAEDTVLTTTAPNGSVNFRVLANT